MRNTMSTNTRKQAAHPRNVLWIWLVYFIWIVCAVFAYRAIFTRYGLIRNMVLRHKIYQSNAAVANMMDEKNAILHRIYLIRNNDVDLLEELTIQYLNKIPPGTKVLVK